MRKVNSNEVPEETWSSPKGKYGAAGREISVALGNDQSSPDRNNRHPFDVEIIRIPPRSTPYPYHSHSAQWEFYHVIAGQGVVRHQDGIETIAEGDAFVFSPGEPHQLTNNSAADLILYVIADNPLGESCHYPDSKKWLVRSPERRLLRGEADGYYDGEE